MLEYVDREANGHYEAGDHLVQPGAFGVRGADHHALYLHDGKVLHYNNSRPGSMDVVVRIDPVELLEERASQIGETVKVRVHKTRKSPEGSVQTCTARLNEREYDFFYNNCEHLVNWCVLGDPVSEQTGSRTPSTNGYLIETSQLGMAYSA